MSSSPTREDITEPLTLDEIQRVQRGYAQSILDNRGYIPGHYAFEFVKVYWDPSLYDFTLDPPEGRFPIMVVRVERDFARAADAVILEELIGPPSSPYKPAERKPVEGDCEICTLPLNGPADTDNEDKTGDETELVWCQRQCGKNYHKICIGSWHDQCLESSWPIACPNCRVDWLMLKPQFGRLYGKVLFPDGIWADVGRWA